jgi:hypothetical protein
VAVVDSAFTTALATEDLLDALGARAPTPGRDGTAVARRVATTGDVEAFRVVARRLFGASLPRVEAAELARV